MKFCRFYIYAVHYTLRDASRLHLDKLYQIYINFYITLLLSIKYFSMNVNLIKKQVLPLMCSFVQASKITREFLWGCGGPAIYLDQLSTTDEAMNAKILDSIAFWLQADTIRVEEVLAQDQHINIITQILKKTELIYLNIITIISRLTRVSKSVALAFSVNEEFVSEIIHRMVMKESRVTSEPSNPQVIKQGLEILLNICVAHPNAKTFINNHGLHPLFLQIAKMAKAKNLVIIEEIVGTLLNIYGGVTGPMGTTGALAPIQVK